MFIIVSGSEIVSAPPAVRDFFVQLMQSSALTPRPVEQETQSSDLAPEPAEQEPALPVNGNTLAELSQSQAEKFLDGCSDKTIRVIRAIVDKNGRALVSEIAASIGQQSGELSGVWGGLTKRTATVLGHKGPKLLDWDNIYEGGQCIDWRSIMAKRTVEAFRNALAARSLAVT